MSRLEKRYLNLYWEVVNVGAYREKEAVQKQLGILTLKENRRWLCQAKRSNECERYRKRNRPWPHSWNEVDMSQKGTRKHGTRWVSKWLKSQRKERDKLRFGPQASFSCISLTLYQKTLKKMLHYCSKSQK